MNALRIGCRHLSFTARLADFNKIKNGLAGNDAATMKIHPASAAQDQSSLLLTSVV